MWNNVWNSYWYNLLKMNSHYNFRGSWSKVSFYCNVQTICTGDNECDKNWELMPKWWTFDRKTTREIGHCCHRRGMSTAGGDREFSRSQRSRCHRQRSNTVRRGSSSYTVNQAHNHDCTELVNTRKKEKRIVSTWNDKWLLIGGSENEHLIISQKAVNID